MGTRTVRAEGPVGAKGPLASVAGRFSIIKCDRTGALRSLVELFRQSHSQKLEKTEKQEALLTFADFPLIDRLLLRLVWIP